MGPKTDLTQVTHGRLSGQDPSPTPAPGTRGPAPLRSPCPPRSFGPPSSHSGPCPSVLSQAKLQVSDESAFVLSHSVSAAMFHALSNAAHFSGVPRLNQQAWPSEGSGAVCSALTDSLRLSVSGGQSQSLCGTGPGRHPHAPHHTQGCPQHLHRAEPVGGQRGTEAGGRPCTQSEAGHSGKEARWRWGFPVRI